MSSKQSLEVRSIYGVRRKSRRSCGRLTIQDEKGEEVV